MGEDGLMGVRNLFRKNIILMPAVELLFCESLFSFVYFPLQLAVCSSKTRFFLKFSSWYEAIFQGLDLLVYVSQNTFIIVAF